MASKNFQEFKADTPDVIHVEGEATITAAAYPSGIATAFTNDVTITSKTVGVARNADTVTFQVLAATNNPTNTVLAAFTGTADAVTITTTPNDGTNNSAPAHGHLSPITTPVTITSRTSDDSRNGDIIVTAVEPAAANAGNAIGIEFLGSEDATFIKVTPNDGTNNSASTAATAVLNLNADITLTSVAKGEQRNGDTFTIQVAAAAANPTNTVLAAFSGTDAAIIATVTPNDGTNNPVAAATADLATSTPIVLTSVSPGTHRNGDSFTIQVDAAAANPTNTVLAAFTGTGDAITATVTPNDGTNNPANASATATIATTTPIVLTNAVAGTARNGKAFTIQVLAAAANPTNTLLASFTEAAGDYTVEVTPNDGTNNPVAAATATLNLTDDIILTSVATGTARNGKAFTLEVLAAAANPTNTVLAEIVDAAGDLTLTITPNDGTNNPANTAATGSSYGYDTEIALTQSVKGAFANTYTFTIDIAAAAANADDKILVEFTGATAAAITCTVTPNDGTNNGSIPVYPSTEHIVEMINTGAVSGQDWVITDASGYRTLQTATGGDNQLLQNGQPEDLMLITFAGGVDVPVSLTTAEVVELINTAAVSGKTVTVTDVGSNLNDQTATGGGATLVVDAGEGDGATDNFAAGTNPAVNMTTAELVEMINTGLISGKTVTITDAGGLRNDQTATGGGANNLANGGEGDGATDNFAGGTQVAVALTTAELKELINNGTVVGKSVTVTDASSLRALQTATGGDATPLADGGEGDGVTDTFSGGTNPAVNLTTAELVELLNTGAVVGKTVTVTDASGLRVKQTATGGDATNLADGGEGDGVSEHFSGGVNVAINLTTAELVEYLSTGAVVGKTISLTDSGSLRSDLTATGGGPQNLVASGEGDLASCTLAGGYKTAVYLTSAEMVELINTGSVVGKTVTLSDAGGLRADLTASGGGAQNMVDAGEGDGASLTLAGGSAASVSNGSNVYGISSITRTGTGTYRFTLVDRFYSFKSVRASFLSATAQDLLPQVKAETVNASTHYVDVMLNAAGTPTDPTTSGKLFLDLALKEKNTK